MLLPKTILQATRRLTQVLEELVLSQTSTAGVPFCDDWSQYLGPVVQLTHLKRATIRSYPVVDVSQLWGCIHAPSGVKLLLAQESDSFAGIFHSTSRHLRHPEYNAIQIQFQDTAGDEVDCLINVYKAPNAESAPHPGISFETDLDGALSILPDLAAHVDVDSIHYLHFNATAVIFEDSTMTRICEGLRPFSFVTAFTLQTNSDSYFHDIVLAMLPNLHSLTVELLYADYELDVNDVPVYTWWWETLNCILEERVHIGKPIHRLQLVGNWEHPYSSAPSSHMDYVDRQFVKQARSFVTELIDNRIYNNTNY